ncbi:hypothetical protein DBV08_00270 [Rhodococcus sp. KBW08]|nr:hypothetical protein DBV08_00270 [Rhodococcus sp. KBW08]
MAAFGQPARGGAVHARCRHFVAGADSEGRTQASRDVAEHHAAVAERIVEFDDVISSLVAATLARVNLQQDTDLRKITAWASVAAFVTAFAGIYGMNFQFMPELGWRYGYLLWWIIAVSLFTLFRRKRWL